jgi:hypothetical protein
VIGGVAELVERWRRDSGGELRPVEREFIERVGWLAPRSKVLWREPERRYGGLALEGDADAPVFVCYCYSEARRSGLTLAYEWRLRDYHDAALDWRVWLAHLIERLDEAGFTLPKQAGPDGVARF